MIQGRHCLVVVVVLLMACSSPAATDSLNVSNATTIPVGVFVNGSKVADVDPHDAVEIAPIDLPPPPWAVDVRTSGDRSLVSLDVGANPVTRTVYPDGHEGMSGPGTRVDLSCGRIDVWVGPPLLGPAPEPGTPGDRDA
jgi:hypothetical protein